MYHCGVINKKCVRFKRHFNTYNSLGWPWHPPYPVSMYYLHTTRRLRWVTSITMHVFILSFIARNKFYVRDNRFHYLLNSNNSIYNTFYYLTFNIRVWCKIFSITFYIGYFSFSSINNRFIQTSYKNLHIPAFLIVESSRSSWKSGFIIVYTITYTRILCIQTYTQNDIIHFDGNKNLHIITKLNRFKNGLNIKSI